MADCPQINNTTIIGTSAVSYDSTPLPCTDVKAGDDLNTILTKFDNVICSAINSVNILTEEVMNITEDLMIIGEEIEDINDQIFICCPICDFTITATELPVCEFTASATELPTCNFTGSVNQVPDSTTTTSSSSTSTSTSTTTSSSSTTTTTTTCPCYVWDVNPTAPDVEAGLDVTYIKCNGALTVEQDVKLAGVSICVKTGTGTPVLSKDGPGSITSTVTQTSECCSATPIVCYVYQVNGDPTPAPTPETPRAEHIVQYVNCVTNTIETVIAYGTGYLGDPPRTIENICAIQILADSDYTLTDLTGSCTPEFTTTTSTSTSTTSTSTTLASPVEITMLFFPSSTDLEACARIVSGSFPTVTRFSTSSYIDAGETIYNGPGLTNPFTQPVPGYYGYTITPGPLYAWVYVGTNGVVINSGYCSTI